MRARVAQVQREHARIAATAPVAAAKLAPLIRAVVEGTCMHLRWFLETEDKKTKTSDVLRFVGGGALSDVTSQILADCTGRTVEVVASPQNVGAVGAAVISAVGLGMIGSIEEAKKIVPANKTFIPNTSLKTIY